MYLHEQSEAGVLEHRRVCLVLQKGHGVGSMWSLA